MSELHLKENLVNLVIFLTLVQYVEVFFQERGFYWNQKNKFDSDEDVATLLDAANWAPTHHRSEPWRYVVIPGPGPIIQYLEFIDSWYSNHRYSV